MAQVVSLHILGTPKVTFTAAQTFGLPVGSFMRISLIWLLTCFPFTCLEIM